MQPHVISGAWLVIPLNRHAFFIGKLALYTKDLGAARYHRSA
ncbi:protein of unknown function [Paraburkholderia dioscoreae]|uniref:Uncharacterized protein n=1 Tax=Paraburkholderia dioscoreae TaxID=2604047 RepID=A0A5Q4ZMM3_9BURK|nr:protein of unknown function [Paraburkholderia dioscoreae]